MPTSETESPGPRAEARRRTAFDRRAFLAGALATGALAACGASGSDETDDAGTSTEPDDGAVRPSSDGAELAAGTYTLVQRFPQGLQVPGGQRLPLSLSTGAAELVQDGPTTLEANVADLDGNTIGGRLVATRRDVAPAPYYDFHAAVDEAGFFTLIVDGGPPDGASFQVSVPADVPVPTPGDPLPPFDTPTVDDPRGVDPICTREPEPCPFHDVTLTEALDAAADDGRVVAYYVGTPAFCSTGSCAPALESMIELQGEFADSVIFVHAEVYTDDTATVTAPAVDALGLFYEPTIFVTGSDGVIVDRLDAVWDVTELRETLLRAVG
jgi:hypothetical protein